MSQQLNRPIHYMLNTPTRKLKRFTPAQLRRFQELRATRPQPVDLDCVGHIVFPPQSRFYSDFEMSHEQIAAVSELLWAGKKMQEACAKFESVMPPGACHQFFGNWDYLRVVDTDYTDAME